MGNSLATRRNSIPSSRSPGSPRASSSGGDDGGGGGGDDLDLRIDHGRTVPYGLYPSTQPSPLNDSLLDYDRTIVRKLQQERRLAPFYRGIGDPSEIFLLEPLKRAPSPLPVPSLMTVATTATTTRTGGIKIPRFRRNHPVVRSASLEVISHVDNEGLIRAQRCFSGSQTHLTAAVAASSGVTIGSDLGVITGSPGRTFIVPVTPAPTPASPSNVATSNFHSRIHARNRSISVVIAAGSSRGTRDPVPPRTAPSSSSPVASSRASTVVGSPKIDGTRLHGEYHDATAETAMVDASVVVMHDSTATAQNIAPRMLKSGVQHPPLLLSLRSSRTQRPRKEFTLADLYRDPVECPICFLYYPRNINYTRCCRQPICTECFLQIRRSIPDSISSSSPPSVAMNGAGFSPDPAACPYCVQRDFGVFYRPPAWHKRLSAFFDFADPYDEDDDVAKSGAVSSDASLMEMMTLEEAAAPAFFEDNLDAEVILPPQSTTFTNREDRRVNDASWHAILGKDRQSDEGEEDDSDSDWWGNDIFVHERPTSPDPKRDVTADDVRPELLRRSLAPPPTPPPLSGGLFPVGRRGVMGRYPPHPSSSTPRAHRRSSTISPPSVSGEYSSLAYAMRALGADLEEMMMAEAIRRSLAGTEEQEDPPSPTAAIPGSPTSSTAPNGPIGPLDVLQPSGTARFASLSARLERIMQQNAVPSSSGVSSSSASSARHVHATIDADAQTGSTEDGGRLRKTTLPRREDRDEADASSSFHPSPSMHPS